MQWGRNLEHRAEHCRLEEIVTWSPWGLRTMHEHDNDTGMCGEVLGQGAGSSGFLDQLAAGCIRGASP